VLLIPAIDLRGGHCVRLYQGDFAAETRYLPTPEELVRRYRQLGASWLHVVDLDGARDGTGANRAIIKALAALSTLNLQVGGGVRSLQALTELFDAGVARVVVGSLAVRQPAEVSSWLERFGPERICLAFDVRLDSARAPWVQVHGWTTAAGVTLWDALLAYPTGLVRHLLCTDIARDGALTGPNLALYRECLARFPKLQWQASGGISAAKDLQALAAVGVAVAVSGKALLEERINLAELRPFLPDASSPASTSATARS
jgi:phosphoribosylformimino-5-aminoimidazole carboxamide ribotide isomerase